MYCYCYLSLWVRNLRCLSDLPTSGSTASLLCPAPELASAVCRPFDCEAPGVHNYHSKKVKNGQTSHRVCVYNIYTYIWP